MATGKVTVTPCKVRGKTMWRVRRWQNGKPKRTFFRSKAAADAEAAGLRSQVARTGQAWMSLPADDREDLIQAFSEAKKLGVDIRTAIALAKTDPSATAAPTLAKVIDDLIEAKENAGRSDDYTRTLSTILRQFARDRSAVPVDLVTLADLEMFLDSKALASRSTLRARLSTLFKFAVRRGYRTDNPCAALETVTIAKKAPEIFTPDQFRDAWEWLSVVEPRALAWLVLSTCCGLRPEEAEKTVQKRDIHFKEGFVKVEAQTTKVRQRRVVYPRPEAMALLKAAIAIGGELPLDPRTRRIAIQGRRNRSGSYRSPGLRDALGFKAWPKDITRHTAASYWLADGTTAGHVSEMLGNSERVLKRDYKALVTRKEAGAFWALVRELAR